MLCAVTGLAGATMRYRFVYLPLLSLKTQKLSHFRQQKQERVRQQDQQVDQHKDQL
jgi:hypothetical protein